ncbi:hypothetical protein RB653_009343 [Dictyostelium firmibasis]|uniref:Uncharacterized protein n=1 Tax=Dictyostelium firmibasis TaxID=79012 RepID=A0AAN7U433_9MYCE
MPLNLVARKSLRDNEEHLKKAHEEIKNALSGEEWVIEFDWDLIFEKIDEHNKKQLGEVFYKNLCPHISKCIVNACKDDLTKESIINANTSKKIVLIVNEDPKNTSYWKYEFNNGQLNLLFKKGCCNLSDAANFQLHKVIPSEGCYTLPTRLNLKKNQDRYNAAFERIKAITNKDWSFDEESMESVYPTAFETDSQREQFGDSFASVLEYSTQNIEKRCKNEITLESFNEATTNARFSFRHCPKQTTGYWSWSFDNGDIVISFKSVCNISDNANFDFIKVLPVPGVFSLAARLNMKENQEKFDNSFERIKQVTNIDWSYDQESLEQVYPTLEDRNKEILGDIFSQVFKYIADNITNRCKNEIALEAFIEATSNAKIVLRSNSKLAGTYWSWSFEKGDLVVTFKSICNISDNANFDFIKVLPVPGVFSLAARLNMKESLEKFESSFQRIKQVLHNDWSYDESSLEQVYPTLEEHNKLRVGEIFSEVIKFVADNIVKRCSKEEMVLEALVETVTNSKIVFRSNPKLTGTYWSWSFENGDLVITFKSICNVSDNVNFDFVKILPSPGVLTLASRINLKENQEKIQESFEKMKLVLNSDWSYDESSLEQVYPKLEEHNKPRVGEVLAEIIRYISQNIVKRCADELVREAFIECVSNSKIIFRFIEKQPSYWIWNFEGGNLIVSFKSISNISDNANFNFETLL